MTDTELLKDTIEYYAEDPERRAIHNGRCLYRTPDGKKCAIGRQIPDDKYTAEFENATLPLPHYASTPDHAQLLLKEALPEDANLCLLDMLQTWHDMEESFGIKKDAIVNVLDCVERCITGPDVEIFIGTFDE